MASRDDFNANVTPHTLLKAYACGIFPMAESADDNTLYWIEPERRGILPLEDIHIPRRLKRTIRQQNYDVRINTDFPGIIEGCGSKRAGRRSTWINDRITQLYGALFRMGSCHTVEVWRDNKLIGGLYGVHMGAAFFGESMFSYETDASKIALTYLVSRLIAGGFCLLDTQFVTTHLSRFGAIEIPRAVYQTKLERALKRTGDYFALSVDASPEEVLQAISQTSITSC